MEINKLLSLAVNVAVSSGKILAEEKKSKIIFETGHDIKLQADKDSEQRIFEILKSTGLNILSEEAGYIEQNSNNLFCWIVDPLDGSLNYVRQIPLSCISIALWDGDKPLFGVVYDYVHDSLYKGIVGEYATLNDIPIRVSEIKSQNKAIIATGFPVYSSFDDITLINFVRTLQNYKKIRLFGTAAFSMMMLAKGSVEAYQENNIAWWDVAAGIAIVLAAGGKVNFEFTNRQKYLLNVLATNENLELNGGR